MAGKTTKKLFSLSLIGLIMSSSKEGYTEDIFVGDAERKQTQHSK